MIFSVAVVVIGPHFPYITESPIYDGTDQKYPVFLSALDISATATVIVRQDCEIEHTHAHIAQFRPRLS